MKSKISRRLRSIFLVALFVLTLVVPASVDRAQAQIGKLGHEIDYYSDATYTNLVGFVIYCRSGQIIRWGRATSFTKVLDSGC